jgi:ankyrin repeat protein
VEAGLPEAIWRAAAEKGNAHAVAAWLDEGGGVDARCAEHGSATLLMTAACAGQEAMVRMLLQRGASVNLQNSDGVTALMGAAFKGHTTVVQALLDAKSDASLQTNNGNTALMCAEHSMHTATAQLLRQHATPQTAEAEGRAATSAAHAAVAANTMAAELLGQEAVANTGKGSKKKKAKAAPSAVAAESAAAAPFAGASKPAYVKEGLHEALFCAALGDAQVVTAWLDKGGGVDARCAEQNRVTLLMAAAAGGQEVMVRMLLQRGASVNLQNSFGRPSLMIAAVLGHSTIVQALLDAKADTSLRSIDGSTALICAEQEKHAAVEQLLRQHAKRPAAEEPEARAAAAAAEPLGKEVLNPYPNP